MPKDWLFHLNLPEFVSGGTKFRVHNDIVLTVLEPGPHIISRSTKIIVVIELTCPNDAKLESWRKAKREIYGKLGLWTTHG